MLRIALAFVIVIGISLFSLQVTESCGDKALRIGRGIRFKRVSHPAAVLIYIPSNPSRSTQLQSMLKKIGHKPYAVNGADGLSKALTSGQYDLVLTEDSMASAVDNQLQTLSLKPVLVPVVSNGTKSEIAAARKQHKYVVKNPRSAEDYLETIEQAMQSRSGLLSRNAAQS